MLLQTESSIPRILRIHLRHAEPKRLLTDYDLESKISRHIFHIRNMKQK